MKEENLFHRRMSLSPNATSPSPPKIDHRSLTRNLSYGGESELFPLNPGMESEGNGLSMMSDELSPAQSPSSKSESRMFNNGLEDCSSPTEKLARKESLKVQKKNYRQEKKRAAKELSSALKDPSVVITANWLKIRGSLKSWTKLWCALKPGVLLIYKTPKSDHWVGTLLLNACKLIERPSKKDGFCFKLYHPLDKSIWAVKGPKGENVGSITQPLPSNYLIFRAASESDGRCWMDALELALSCSSLYKLTAKAGRDGDLSTSSESSHILQLLQSTALTDAELLQLANQQMENDGYSEKSEHDAQEDWDNGANENGGRLTEESDMDQSDELSPGLQATSYVEQSQEEMAEAGEASQVETVSEENKGLIWTLLKQLRPGMDLSKVVLPTFILEPRSFLDKLSDYYYHANLLSEAAREESPYGRIKQVVRWYLSGFYKKPKGLKKPYNPILGETFRCCWLHPQTDSCTFYIAEQISHHPPISAFYICNKKDGFYISGSILAKSKFYGNSLSAILDGRARLMLLGRDEEYVITMPYAHCKGILYGTMTLELGGKITIECEKTKYVAELEFKLKPFLGGSSSVNVISGKIQQGDELLATVDGHWDGEVFLQEKKSGQQEHLWNPTPEVRSTRLKRQVVQLDQQGQFESERLWQHVTRAIVDRDQNQATQEKFVLEEAQRNQAKDRGDQPWRPRLFNLDSVTNEWTYTHIDTRPWDPERCLVQFEKHGVIQTKEKSQRRHKGLAYSRASAWASQQKAQVNGKHRKGSSQPSSCSQNTESSSTTPEPTHESSDNEGYLSQCARCNKEVKDIALIEASIASVQKTQQDIQRNLIALGRQLGRRRETEDNVTLTGRHCFILCVLLLSQLFLNYIFT
ncbi:oxysterol-binding protein-related protein 5 [Salvelinus sp. IW2-2015]|uniref:oxysterol-binding protein-related protein 5 n=1 Tax=Salvelinus sp. IW2-2015 TaxID=2691554 RepID=UPI000CDFAA61|nr:oxysterol-binding protein-related protein 5 isoform X1 [Salvelinus alpinus]XP_023840484.1 oxysterol-binding protein-related protein 5 isoform X1 [Salvelinus alpinus]XP_023840485.1 oxysterol-binding protein-related protein 5 isoform X1 [Salvelinus alpinus]XP_023840486.1 oxysterol-binding protein-related protein 5 isoform X1 [Salvelinus alpinus]XP_023840487.1 oxysterol-binding protein-related protein 5 isoform X1 [Salvelinus alpinus]